MAKRVLFALAFAGLAAGSCLVLLPRVPGYTWARVAVTADASRMVILDSREPGIATIHDAVDGTVRKISIVRGFYGLPCLTRDGSALITPFAKQPGEEMRLVRIPLDGSAQVVLGAPSGSLSVSSPVCMPDGDGLLFAAAFTRSSDIFGGWNFWDWQIYRLSLSSGAITLAYDTTLRDVGKIDVSPDGKLMVLADQGQLHVVELTSRKGRKIRPDTGCWNPVFISQREIVFAGSGDSVPSDNYEFLYRFDLANGRQSQITSLNTQLSAPVSAWKSHQLFFFDEQEPPRLMRLSLRDGNLSVFDGKTWQAASN